MWKSKFTKWKIEPWPVTCEARIATQCWKWVLWEYRNNKRRYFLEQNIPICTLGNIGLSGNVITLWEDPSLSLLAAANINLNETNKRIHPILQGSILSNKVWAQQYCQLSNNKIQLPRVCENAEFYEGGHRLPAWTRGGQNLSPFL